MFKIFVALLVVSAVYGAAFDRDTLAAWDAHAVSR